MCHFLLHKYCVLAGLNQSQFDDIHPCTSIMVFSIDVRLTESAKNESIHFLLHFVLGRGILWNYLLMMTFSSNQSCEVLLKCLMRSLLIELICGLILIWLSGT